MTLMQFHIQSKILQMGMDVWALVPDQPHTTQEPWKVLWLLHGGSGDHTSWVRDTRIEAHAGKYNNLAVILPHAYHSCFVDMAKGARFGEYIGKELPQIMRGLLPRLSARREDNWISGFSNGGYGCLYIGLNNPETFGAIGAYGAGDKADADFSYRMQDKERMFGTGDIKQSPYCVRLTILELAKTNLPKPIVDHGCGEYDPWRNMNELVRDTFLSVPKDPYQYRFTMIPRDGHTNTCSDALEESFLRRMMGSDPE